MGDSLEDRFWLEEERLQRVRESAPPAPADALELTSEAKERGSTMPASERAWSHERYELLCRLAQLAHEEIDPDEVREWLEETYPDYKKEYLTMVDDGQDDLDLVG
jgi:hypothetical protein